MSDDQLSVLEHLALRDVSAAFAAARERVAAWEPAPYAPPPPPPRATVRPDTAWRRR